MSVNKNFINEYENHKEDFENYYKVFSNRLNMAMEFSNKKQIELSEETNISRSLINKYVKGKAIPKKNNLKTISQALNVDESWLIGYSIPTQEYETIKFLLQNPSSKVKLKEKKYNIGDILKILNDSLEKSNLTKEEKDLILSPVKYLYKKNKDS